MLEYMTLKQIDSKINEIKNLAKNINIDINKNKKCSLAIAKLEEAKTEDLITSTAKFMTAYKKIKKYIEKFQYEYIDEDNEIWTSDESFALFKQISKLNEEMFDNAEKAKIINDEEIYEDYAKILSTVSSYERSFNIWFDKEEAKRKDNLKKLENLVNEILNL